MDLLSLPERYQPQNEQETREKTAAWPGFLRKRLFTPPLKLGSGSGSIPN